ncbi:CopD family protein [Sulfitobacter noctilucae]|uniref:CopD family protein n=1 Tax=Sulfitobacter noctilucae TaxID=1342302 RepID=UPI000469B19F|nr:CopD family protein [Sulfitobacter noctilucae]
MSDWLIWLIPIFKAGHIFGLIVWCGGLIGMSLMLALHDPAVSQVDYHRIRRATHLTYTLAVTPAAVLTVIAGTWLIFMRGTFFPWFYAKLFFVMLLVSAHIWIGEVLVSVADSAGRKRPPHPWLPIAAILVPATFILFLVLAKPDLGWLAFPDWLQEPLDADFPLDVPRL